MKKKSQKFLNLPSKIFRLSLGIGKTDFRAVPIRQLHLFLQPVEEKKQIEITKDFFSSFWIFRMKKTKQFNKFTYTHHIIVNALIKALDT